MKEHQWALVILFDKEALQVIEENGPVGFRESFFLPPESLPSVLEFIVGAQDILLDLVAEEHFAGDGLHLPSATFFTKIDAVHPSTVRHKGFFQYLYPVLGSPQELHHKIGEKDNDSLAAATSAESFLIADAATVADEVFTEKPIRLLTVGQVGHDHLTQFVPLGFREGLQQLLQLPKRFKMLVVIDTLQNQPSSSSLRASLSAIFAPPEGIVKNGAIADNYIIPLITNVRGTAESRAARHSWSRLIEKIYEV
jgi:hypothetical protein